jgi:hypothetical protein
VLKEELALTSIPMVAGPPGFTPVMVLPDVPPEVVAAPQLTMSDGDGATQVAVALVGVYRAVKLKDSSTRISSGAGSKLTVGGSITVTLISALTDECPGVETVTLNVTGVEFAARPVTRLRVVLFDGFVLTGSKVRVLFDAAGVQVTVAFDGKILATGVKDSPTKSVTSRVGGAGVVKLTLGPAISCQRRMG